MSGWEMQEVEWWSPLHVARLGTDGPKGVAAKAKGSPGDLLTVAARRAFWQVPESCLDDLATLYKVKASGTCFAKVRALMLHFLKKLPEAELVEMLSQRAFPPSAWGSAWLVTDDVLEELSAEQSEAFKARG